MSHRMTGIPVALAASLATACIDVPTGLLASDQPKFSNEALSASAEMLSAAQPEPNVTITVFVHHFPDGSSEATWSATGAFSDAGTVESTKFEIVGGPPVFSAGSVIARAIMHGERGTFQMHNREHFIKSPDLHNTWVAGLGTGFYENLEGRGSFTVTHETESALGQVVFTGYARL